jgi:fucose 4-O-acetylase-like acetyltransferase
MASSHMRIEAPAAVALASPTERAALSRLGWVDVAKGVGIILVVAGHSLDGIISAGMTGATGVLAAAQYWIYTFHMPLFFLLAGLFIYRRVRDDTSRFLKTTATRILWPYLLWSLIQGLIVMMAAPYVNHPPQAGDSILSMLLWDPGAQFWFLYALLLMHLASVLIVPALGPRALFGVAVVFFCFGIIVPLPRVFSLACYFFPFYASGVWVGWSDLSVSKVPAALRRPWTWIGAGAAWMLCAGLAYAHGDGYWSVATYPAAVFGIIAVLSIATAPAVATNRFLAFVGARSMSIFLLHVLFVASVRVALEWRGGITSAALLVPLLITAGIIGPLIVAEIADRLAVADLLGLGRRATGTTPRSASSLGPETGDGL